MPPTDRGTLRTPRRAYIRGLSDGVLLALDHIEGNVGPGVNEDATYKGPMPAELTEFIARVRARVEASPS